MGEVRTLVLHACPRAVRSKLHLLSSSPAGKPDSPVVPKAVTDSLDPNGAPGFSRLENSQLLSESGFLSVDEWLCFHKQILLPHQL